LWAETLDYDTMEAVKRWVFILLTGSF